MVIICNCCQRKFSNEINYNSHIKISKTKDFHIFRQKNTDENHDVTRIYERKTLFSDEQDYESNKKNFLLSVT